MADCRLFVKKLNFTDWQCSVIYQKVKQLAYHSCFPTCGHSTRDQPTVRPKLPEENFSPKYTSNYSLSRRSLLAQRLMGASLSTCAGGCMFQPISCFRLRTRCAEGILFVSRGLPAILMEQY